MRRFLDEHGAEWTVALSSGSYGSISLVFAASGEVGSLYFLAIEAETAAEGQQMLKNQTEEELRERLARAESWTE